MSNSGFRFRVRRALSLEPSGENVCHYQEMKGDPTGQLLPRQQSLDCRKSDEYSRDKNNVTLLAENDLRRSLLVNKSQELTTSNEHCSELLELQEKERNEFGNRSQKNDNKCQTEYKTSPCKSDIQSENFPNSLDPFDNITHGVLFEKCTRSGRAERNHVVKQISEDLLSTECMKNKGLSSEHYHSEKDIREIHSRHGYQRDKKTFDRSKERVVFTRENSVDSEQELRTAEFKNAAYSNKRKNESSMISEKCDSTDHKYGERHDRRLHYRRSKSNAMDRYDESEVYVNGRSDLSCVQANRQCHSDDRRRAKHRHRRQQSEDRNNEHQENERLHDERNWNDNKGNQQECIDSYKADKIRRDKNTESSRNPNKRREYTHTRHQSMDGTHSMTEGVEIHYDTSYHRSRYDKQVGRTPVSESSGNDDESKGESDKNKMYSDSCYHRSRHDKPVGRTPVSESSGNDDENKRDRDKNYNTRKMPKTKCRSNSIMANVDTRKSKNETEELTKRQSRDANHYIYLMDANSVSPTDSLAKVEKKDTYVETNQCHYDPDEDCNGRTESFTLDEWEALCKLNKDRYIESKCRKSVADNGVRNMKSNNYSDDKQSAGVNQQLRKGKALKSSGNNDAITKPLSDDRNGDRTDSKPDKNVHRKMKVKTSTPITDDQESDTEKHPCSDIKRSSRASLVDCFPEPENDNDLKAEHVTQCAEYIENNHNRVKTLIEKNMSDVSKDTPHDTETSNLQFNRNIGFSSRSPSVGHSSINIFDTTNSSLERENYNSNTEHDMQPDKPSLNTVVDTVRVPTPGDYKGSQNSIKTIMKHLLNPKASSNKLESIPHPLPPGQQNKSPSRESHKSVKSKSSDNETITKIAPVSEVEEKLYLSLRENNASNPVSWSPSMSHRGFGDSERGQEGEASCKGGNRRKTSEKMEIESLNGSAFAGLKIEDDCKKALREDDCAMSTILQPTAMLRKEVALHEACKTNKCDVVVKILQDKIDINCKNNLDRTPLHWACAKGHLPIVEILVEHGADLEARDKYGMRPVLWAALYGHVDIVRFLVNAGATATCTNRQGMGLLHCATQNNHIHVMNFIFESLENVDINCAEKNEKTSLHVAAEEGHLDVVMRLIDLRCDVNRRDSDCCSALHLAAKRGHHAVVKRLLMVGVNVDDREAEGRTALHFAAEEGHLDTVEVLADFNAGADAETIKEWTPLHCAAIKGHTAVCQRLIKLGASINTQNHQGNTALHLAVIGNYRDLAQVLVEAKAEIDLPNHRLQTPLHVAVESGYQDLVEVLLVGNASLSTREKSGKTALHLAARGSFVTIVDMIIKAERYFSMNREYHENDLDFVDPRRYLRQPSHPSWPQIKELLWTLATKNFKPADWKKLSVHWKFTQDHIRCIEHQYTGTSSHKEHGFRLLMIWLHGVRKDENVTKLLFEALVAIDRRSLAEQVRRWSNSEPEKPCLKVLCGII